MPLFPRSLRLALVLAGLFLACGLGPSAEEQRPSLRSLGGEPLSQLPLVPRLRLEAVLPVRTEDLWLVRGGVSDKELAQVLAGEPSSALQERRIPLATWESAGGLTLASLTVLEPSQEYTLLALELGEVARVATAAQATPVLWRWGSTRVAPRGWVLHCAAPPPWSIEGGEALASEVAESLLLEPEGQLVDVLVDLGIQEGGTSLGKAQSGGRSGCVRFQVPAGLRTFLPPHRIGEHFFEPALLTVDESGSATNVVAPTVHTIGSAAFLHVLPSVTELTVSRASAAGDGEGMGGSSAAGSLVRAWSKVPTTVPLGHFAAGSYLLSLSGFDPGGASMDWSLPFEITEERGFFVLSEVMANPLGPEPDSEWVEIVNVGRAPLSLDGYFLEDSEAVTRLPPVVVPAGGVGLVVASTFVAGSSGDVVPAAEAIPVVVDIIGDGLTNSGETVRLRAPGGDLVSEIPARAAEAGRSVARRHLLAPDWDTSFAPHAAPGASPGRSNALD